MFVLNVIVALVIATGIWYAGSWGLTILIYRIETRDPAVVDKPSWRTLETAMNIAVFVGSVAVWIALSYYFQQLSR